MVLFLHKVGVALKYILCTIFIYRYLYSNIRVRYSTFSRGMLGYAGLSLSVWEGKATGSKLIYSRGSITFSSGGFLQFCVRISIEPYHSSTEKILA